MPKINKILDELGLDTDLLDKVKSAIVQECVNILDILDTYDNGKEFRKGFQSAKNSGIRAIKNHFDT